MQHYNLGHEFIPMPQAMKIPVAKAAVDKGWKKLETIPAWNLEKVKSKNEVSLEAQRDEKKVHFATSMDICHIQNKELEPQFQKYKGRVVLSEDTVKDDVWPVLTCPAALLFLPASRATGCSWRLCGNNVLWLHQVLLETAQSSKLFSRASKLRA